MGCRIAEIPQPAAPVLVDHVSKRFGSTVALDDVSLTIGRGEVFGLLGPNGAGKTTLIRAILDIIKPDSGRIDVFGRPFQPDDRDRIGYLPEERGLYPRQPVDAVLEYLGSLRGLTPTAARTETARWLDRFGLSDVRSRKVEQLSKGNQQKAQIAAALLARPPILILDEPLSGLDPISARTVNDIIRECAGGGQTVVLSTHQMGLVEALCTRVFMIARGRAVLYGDLKDIQRRHSMNTVRVQSTAEYARCPHVAHVTATAGASGRAVDVDLREGVTSDEFLGWLVAHGAQVDRFERCWTPLEDIFVRIAQTTPGTS
jgi:ABC-2 type transport system ATP-binding protein